ncbi:hypothetical protein EI42_05640 [Thermosporothrix hazakensis]|jgi:hypothetical protein|uniref:Uncharacterized protein n=1 Tax=Thermosporothrix hazakensis TaxID=644383 RepID=A0A326TXG5_THEHA|nr:hypothetical protein EI42_05640 [Thermosporothrix hazakensis]GCE50729.1 hypothetical protein KTH_55980 [Thermosporothrix hazakensis]
MSSLSIQTSSQSVPSTPSWFGEVVLIVNLCATWLGLRRGNRPSSPELEEILSKQQSPHPQLFPSAVGQDRVASLRPGEISECLCT